MKTIEMMVKFTVQVEDENVPEFVEDLFLELPLSEVKLRSVTDIGKDIPAKFTEFETMESYEI